MDFEKKVQSGAKKCSEVIYCSELVRKMVFDIQKANLVVIQSSRFRWYSFVFERTQSRLIGIWFFVDTTKLILLEAKNVIGMVDNSLEKSVKIGLFEEY